MPPSSKEQKLKFEQMLGIVGNTLHQRARDLERKDAEEAHFRRLRITGEKVLEKFDNRSLKLSGVLHPDNGSGENKLVVTLANLSDRFVRIPANLRGERPCLRIWLDGVELEPKGDGGSISSSKLTSTLPPGGHIGLSINLGSTRFQKITGLALKVVDEEAYEEPLSLGEASFD